MTPIAVPGKARCDAAGPASDCHRWLTEAVALLHQAVQLVQRLDSPAVAARNLAVADSPLAQASVIRDAEGKIGGPGSGEPADRSGAWLRNAILGLAVLAVAAAVVSYQAQYRMVAGYKHAAAVAALQAGIPDAAAMVFASLGIALALHGRRAIRARALNVVSVGTSVAMNALAASPGWRALAIWILPSAAYAVASDTLIGVVRAWAIARQQALRLRLSEDEATPLAIIGGLVLWLLRLALAPVSTLRAFRAWVIEECPVAPGRRSPAAATARSAMHARPVTSSRRVPRPGRGGTKTARFLDLVAERHGPLVLVPAADVSKISAELAPVVGLHAGSARTALRRAVLAAQDGGSR
jgi:hypothetical protein